MGKWMESEEIGKWMEARKALKGIMENIEFYFEEDSYTNVRKEWNRDYEKVLDYLDHVERKLINNKEAKNG